MRKSARMTTVSAPHSAVLGLFEETGNMVVKQTDRVEAEGGAGRVRRTPLHNSDLQCPLDLRARNSLTQQGRPVDAYLRSDARTSRQERVSASSAWNSASRFWK